MYTCVHEGASLFIFCCDIVYNWHSTFSSFDWECERAEGPMSCTLLRPSITQTPFIYYAAPPNLKYKYVISLHIVYIILYTRRRSKSSERRKIFCKLSYSIFFIVLELVHYLLYLHVSYICSGIKQRCDAYAIYPL